MAYCSNCGAKLEDGDLFCGNCGEKQIEMQTEIQPAQEITTRETTVPEKTAPKRRTPAKKRVETVMREGQIVGGSGNIRYCEDGKYRWIYELSMFKNPSILFTVWKVLAISGLFPAILSAIGSRDGLLVFIEVYGIIIGIFTVLGLLAYFILALFYRGKYIVLFEMSEDGVVHKQQDKQFNKAQGIAWLNMMAGSATGNPGMTGRGILVSGHNSLSSDFKHVKKVTCIRSRNTIKLDELFAHNQVYVEKEDWDFVKDFIVSRCTNAKIR